MNVRVEGREIVVGKKNKPVGKFAVGDQVRLLVGSLLFGLERGLRGVVVWVDAESISGGVRYRVYFGKDFVYGLDFREDEIELAAKHGKPGEKFDHPSLSGRMDGRVLRDGDWFRYTKSSDRNAFVFDSSALFGEDKPSFEKRRVGRHVYGLNYVCPVGGTAGAGGPGVNHWGR